jgi:hypothetical protein
LWLTWEVGLPVYHVVLQASTLLRKKTPPLEEFIMRCLKFGMSDSEEISRFLGLELHTVESVVTFLHSGLSPVADPIPAGDVRNHAVEPALQAARETLHATSVVSSQRRRLGELPLLSPSPIREAGVAFSALRETLGLDFT